MKLSKEEREAVAKIRQLKNRPHCPQCEGRGYTISYLLCEYYDDDEPQYPKCTVCKSSGRVTGKSYGKWIGARDEAIKATAAANAALKALKSAPAAEAERK